MRHGVTDPPGQAALRHGSSPAWGGLRGEGSPHIPALMQEENRLQPLASCAVTQLQRPGLRDSSLVWEGKRGEVWGGGGEQSSQCVIEPARGSLLHPPATSGKHLFTSFGSSSLHRPSCFFSFFFTSALSSLSSHQHRKPKCN